MEINGITFEDWAAASANMAQGMSTEEVCKILGVEEPVFADANTKWAEKLADLMTEDMSIAGKYGEIFNNPKVGKFANAGTTINIEDVLKKVPDGDTFLKIMHHSSQASEVGLDAGSIMKNDYNLSIAEWAKAGEYYGAWMRDESSAESFASSNEKWETYYKEFYKDQGTDLADDIDF